MAANTESDITDISQDHPSDNFLSGYGYAAEDEYGEEEEEHFIPTQIVLRSEDFISGPFRSRDSTIPINILEFDFSFGYDCKKYYNLVVADPDTIMFISGNLINFFDVPTRSLTFRRSAFGGGLGHITKNPNENFPHIAVAENGEQPPIIVYQWPSLDIVCLLRGGTSKCYNHLNYSPNGDLLVSQGGEPDHLITVWNWPKSRILLRTKSYVSDVYRVLFSPYCPGQLSSCGMGHIKFWKMARTFTGLKLQGELGRFGKTEYSDILGIYPMPDEKVISGCDWGNILIWEAGLIKLEVFRKLRKTCHDGPIVQFDFIDGELWTVSMDGSVRVWHYDTIDQADPPDEDRVVQMEPIFDFRTEGAQFMCIAKRSNHPDDTFYYAQDGNGGLWLIDLTIEINVTPSEQLYVCHAGAVADIATCPYGTFLVSFGVDGRLHLYDYVARKLLLVQQFSAKGVCMIWLPISVEITGDVLILGFDDGCLRVIVLTIKDYMNEYRTTTIQITKPHNKPLRCMSLNKTEDILVTAGEDVTIFVYQIQSSKERDYIELLPIGYVATSDIVTYITFHNTENYTVILGCEHGYINVINLPKEQQDYTTITYVLHVKRETEKFLTYKSQIRRDIKLREIAARKAKKRAKKQKELDAYRKENPGLEIDEEIFLADSESEEKLEPLFIPDVPNKVLWLQHTVDNTLWLSMAGFDAGYVYEYELGQAGGPPIKYKMVYDADDTEINSFLYNYNRKYLIFAMQSGEIRINKVKPDFHDLSDFWQLSMHDNYKGYIPKMCFSYDEQYFFTCGHDGNVFAYRYYPEDDDYCDPSIARTRKLKTCELESVEDVDTYTNLSLEETIVKAEEDRKAKLANDHKKQYLDSISKLKKEFQLLLKKNQKLLPTQRLPREKLELDYRITKHLNDILEANLALVRRKLAYDLEKSETRMRKLKKHFTDPLDLFPITVKAVRKPIQVSTLRQKRLPDGFAETQEYIEQKLIEAELKGRAPERQQVVIEPPPLAKKKSAELEYFLLGISAYTLQEILNAKILRLLKKYRMRKLKMKSKQAKWDKFNATKPVAGVNHPDDEAAYAAAVETIGDYKLKSAPEYTVPKHLRESKLKKYKTLLAARERQFNLRHDFNVRVHNLRQKKVELRDNLQRQHDLLEDIHKEIPPSSRLKGPDVIKIPDEDFPEKNLDLVMDLPLGMQKPTSKVTMVTLEPSQDLLQKEVLPCLDYGVALEEGEALSSWENEMKQIRIKRKLFQQRITIIKMENAIDKFDNAVEETYRDYLQCAVDAKFLDIHILTLNQELMILKQFEFGENKLADDIRNLQEEVLDLRDILNDLNNKIDNHKREIEKSEADITVIQKKFLDATGDNKFYDFLRRIFKKKYKPPKVKTDDDDSDSESSSSSSDDDDDDEEGSSVDSRDVGPIRLDENVCPKGCDQALYDLTFELRGERHGIEQAIKDRQAAIELVKKDIELNNKKFKATETKLDTVQEELEAYQREKQQKLNQIMCVVILKMDQLQHLVEDYKLANIKNTLVFSKRILTRLYRRVGQLQGETEYQKQKHRKDILHLGRMNTDCKYMEKDILQLYEKINTLMLQKFGKVVDIDEITEACLKRMVFDVRMSMLDIRSMYHKEMIYWREKFGEKQSELAKVIRKNTDKMELLALLNTEKTDLMKILKSQDSKRAHLAVVTQSKLDITADIVKLAEVVRIQQKELKILRDEIKTLKTKGLQLRPQKQVRLEDLEEEEEELPLMELDETDDVVYLEGFQLRDLVTPHINILQHPLESRNAAREIINNLFDELDLERPAREAADDAVEHLLKQVSVTNMINDLLVFIPRELEEDEYNIVEMIAEKLFSLTYEQAEGSDDNENVAKAAFDAILDETFSKIDAVDDIANMLKELVEEVPLPYILEESSILRIMNKIVNSAVPVDKDELLQKCITITPGQREAMEKILQIILEEVYGVGIDYLYYINL